MYNNQRALIDPSGRIAGQILLWRYGLIGPLHVLDTTSRSPLMLLDAQGRSETYRILEAVVADPASDIAVVRTALAPASEDHLTFNWNLAIGEQVQVHAILGVNRGSGVDVLVTSRTSLIRDVVEVEFHAYRMASGAMAFLRGVRVLFLAHSFTHGWSGAPVSLRGAIGIIGFIHGNATENAGDGVCLLPTRTALLEDTTGQHSLCSCR
jgi:hypothetical protein